MASAQVAAPLQDHRLAAEAGWWIWLGPRTLALGLLVAATALVAVRPVQDPDLWWHLETGRWILAHHAVPVHDLYTFTAQGHRWIDHEWLSEVLIAGVYQLAGFPGLALLFGAVTGLGGLCIFLAAGGLRQPYPVAVGATALALIAMNPSMGARPQMITFALAALTLLWLRRYLAGIGHAPWALPPLMVLWVNLHAGFLIAFVLLGLALVAELIRWRLAGRSKTATGDSHRRRAVSLAVITVLCALATLLNPNGPAEWWYAFVTQGSPAQQTLILEWRSPDFHDRSSLPLEVLILAVGAAVAIRRPNLFDGLLCGVTLVMTLQSQRHVAFFALAAVPLLVEGGSRLFAETRAIRWFGGDARTPVMAALTALLLAIGALGLVGHVSQQLASQDQVTRVHSPVGAADWLAAHPDAGHRMYNGYDWGGYLVYRFWPDPNRRVFAFGEAELLGDPLLAEYERVQDVRPGWLQDLDRRGIDAVVIPRHCTLAAALATEPGWRLAYGDDVSAVYVRS